MTRDHTVPSSKDDLESTSPGELGKRGIRQVGLLIFSCTGHAHVSKHAE